MGIVILGLIGVLLGVLIGRRMAGDSLMTQCMCRSREMVFGEFTNILESCYGDATQALRMLPKDERERDIGKLERQFLIAYGPALGSIRIVQLFLREDYRKEFEELVRGIHALHVDPSFGEERFGTIEKNRARIQEIFEVHLQSPKC